MLLIILIIFFTSYVQALESNIANNSIDHNINHSHVSRYGRGYRYNIQGWIYTYIEGDPYERGYQHGYLLADEIVDMVSRWSNIINNFRYYKTV